MSTPNIRELRKQYARRNTRRFGWSHLLFTLIGLFALYLIVGFFVAPLIVRPEIEKKLSAELHREVRLSELSINPLRLSVTAEGLTIRDRQGGPFVAWKKLFVNFDLWSYFSGELRFQEIALDGFDGRVSVGKDGTLNFGDLLGRDTAPKQAQAHPKVLRIDRLTVTDAHIAYDDLSQATRFSTEMGPMSFVLTNFRTAGSSGAPGDFTATTDSGEEFHWSGTLAVGPLRSSGVVAVSKVGLKKYAPYYAKRVRFDLLDGVIEANFPYTVTTEEGQLVVRCKDATAKLQGLKLAERNQTSPAVALNTIAVYNASAEYRSDRSPVLGIQKVVIEDGKLAVKRDQRGIDLVNLLTPIAAAAQPSAAPTSTAATSSPTNVTLDELAVRNLSISVDDLVPPRPVHQQLDQFSVSLKNVSLAHPEATFPLEMSAKLGTETTLHAEGTIALQPLKAEISVEAKRVSLEPFSPYLESFLNARLAKGSAGATTKVRLGQSGANLVYAAQGDVVLDDVSILDGNGTEFAGWKEISVRGFDYQSSPAKFLATEVNLEEPHGQVIVSANQTLSIESILRPSSSAPAPAAPTVNFGAASPPRESAPMLITIDKVGLNGAVLGLVDLSVQPNVKFNLDQLSGTVSELSSSALTRAKLDLRGQVNGTSPVTISGEINPLNLDGSGDLKVLFKNIELAPLAPYVRKYVGHELQQGDLSLDLKLHLARNRLDSANLATLSRFDLGAPVESPDAVKLPVSITFVLALLRDAQGRIVIDLPVQGDLADPSFQIGPVVRHVLVNLLTKVATSPFSFLGGMFGGGKGEELSYQDFGPGQSIPAEEDEKKLDVVAKALRERPALRLDLEGGYNADADRAILREETLHKRIQTALWEENRKFDPNLGSSESYKVDPEGESRKIREFYMDKFVPKSADPVKDKTTVTTRRPWYFLGLFSLSAPTPPKAAPVAPPKAPAPLPSEAVMREKLLENTDVDDKSLRQLASARAEQVKRYLVEHGEVAADRIAVLGTAKTGETRVELHLK